MISKFKAVFFDAGGTLLHPFPSVGEIYEEVASRYGCRVNANELEAQVDESLLRAPGRYSVVVRNAGVADPQKLGDGSSNRGWLIVGYR